MRELLEEYGSVIVGTGAAAFLILLAIYFLSGGDIYNAIRDFSGKIC